MKHGTRGTYSRGCRCDDCREANTSYIDWWRRVGPDPYQLPVFENEGDVSWMARARCRGLPTGMFFPDKRDRETTEEARKVCGECPVADDCLEYAMRYRRMPGVWGGLSESERRYEAARRWRAC